MLVYRVCNKQEVLSLLNDKSITNIGNTFIINKKLNTFAYKPDQKYLHFFPNYEDLFYVDSKDRDYICTYDIPEHILENSKGIGYYLDRINFRRKESVTEYAVEIEKLEFSYLKQIDRITETILFEEYIEGDYQDRIIPIYDADAPKKELK